MSLDKIGSSLAKLFSNADRSISNRKIIFWIDESKEYFDYVQSYELNDVKIRVCSDNNNFQIKYDIEVKYMYDDFIIYFPYSTSYEILKNSWLLDVYYYSEHFRADLISQILIDLNLSDTQETRDVIKRNKKFFDNQDRVKKLLKLNNRFNKAIELEVGILSVLANAKESKLDLIVRNILTDNTDINNNSILNEISKYSDLNALYNLILRKYGYEHRDEKPLINLAVHLFVSSLAIRIDQSKMSVFRNMFDNEFKENCYTLLRNWFIDKQEINNLKTIGLIVEEYIDISQKFNNFNLDDLSEIDFFPSINDLVIQELVNTLKNDTRNIDYVLELINKRSEMCWYEDYQDLFDVLSYAAKIKKYKNSHQTIAPTNNHLDIWQTYTSDYYQLDNLYRKCVMIGQKIFSTNSSELVDGIKEIIFLVDNIYKNWFLSNLGEGWTRSIEEIVKNNYFLPGIKHQTNFYKDFVSKTLANKPKTFVIISDALRYEVACELNQILNKQNGYQSRIEAIQGIFPSVTPMGMAALLPHNDITLDGENGVLVDGYKCSDLATRGESLKRKGKKSATIDAKTFIQYKRNERIELFKDLELVYLYHNTIDQIGESVTTESKVFEACEQSIDELKNIVEIVRKELNVHDIFITSDHGFIYTLQPLNDLDKIGKSDVDPDVKLFKRYAILDKKVEKDFLLNISLENIINDKFGITPRDYFRFKSSGGTNNFVHGGISIHEIAVPVIKFEKQVGSRLKTSTSKAKIELLSKIKITNRIFKLDFLQTEAINETTLPATYKVVIKNFNGEITSDIQVINADRSSIDANDRKFTLQFCLNSGEYNSNMNHYIVLIDEETEVEKWKVDISILFSGDFDL